MENRDHLPNLTECVKDGAQNCSDIRRRKLNPLTKAAKRMVHKYQREVTQLTFLHKSEELPSIGQGIHFSKRRLKLFKFLHL